MKLQFVRLKNFKSYPDQETELGLNFSGVKLIVGQNGAGKTTFFDAIIWCLYGKSMALADDVVSWATGKNCKVEVGFTIGGATYSIIRYRNHEEQGNKLLFFKNAKNISSRTKGDTQARIDDTIEISYQAMISSVILSSELYSSFLRSKPSERLRAFESILSLKDVNEYNKKLKKLREPLLEEINKLETERIKSSSSLETLTSTIEGYNEKIKKTLLMLKEKKTTTQKKVTELETRINEFREIDVDDELKKNEEFDASVEKNLILFETIKNENARLKDIVSLTNEYNKHRLALDILQKIDPVKEINLIDAYDEVNANNKKVGDAIEKLSNKTQDTTFLITRFEQLSKSLKAKIIELKSLKDHSDTCPVCEQEIKKELSDKLIKEKKDDLVLIEHETEKIKFDLDKMEKENKKISDGCIKLTGLYKKVPEEPMYTKEYIGRISSEMVSLENDIKSITTKIKDTEEYNREIKVRIIDLESEVIKDKEEPEHHTVFLESLKKKVNELELEAEELRSSIIVIDTQAKSSYDKEYVEETKKKITSLKTKITRIDKKLTVKKLEDKHYDALAQVFSNKEVGFKKFFINKMVKIFNDRVNFYLPFFFDNVMSIEFDKDLNEVIMREGKEVHFGSFSSGQKTRFELSISFAMFMMVKTFFSGTVNILVFDEILDTNLDVRGFNSVVEILENLGASNGVFVVSHQEFYKEKFNHHIQVKLNAEGFSYIHKEV